MRVVMSALWMWLSLGHPAFAEVVKATVAARTLVAEGQAFGKTGPYEKVVGTLEFAIDPTHPRNAPIAGLTKAARNSDGGVHFTSNFYVLRPVDPAPGNGGLLVDIANRGHKPALIHAPVNDDPTAPGDFGDGFLMREGYTVVWVGWQFDVAPPLLSDDAPALTDVRTVRTTFIVNARQAEVTPPDLPYAPATADDPARALSVRDKFWDRPSPIDSDQWRLLSPEGRPRVSLASGSSLAESTS